MDLREGGLRVTKKSVHCFRATDIIAANQDVLLILGAPSKHLYHENPR